MRGQVLTETDTTLPWRFEARFTAIGWRERTFIAPTSLKAAIYVRECLSEGSDGGGYRWAVLYSLIEGCTLNDVTTSSPRCRIAGKQQVQILKPSHAEKLTFGDTSTAFEEVMLVCELPRQ